MLFVSILVVASVANIYTDAKDRYGIDDHIQLLVGSLQVWFNKPCLTKWGSFSINSTIYDLLAYELVGPLNLQHMKGRKTSMSMHWKSLASLLFVVCHNQECMSLWLDNSLAPIERLGLPLLLVASATMEPSPLSASWTAFSCLVPPRWLFKFANKFFLADIVENN